MKKNSYKTKQQSLLFSYLKEMQGKHFTAEDIRIHFSEKKISIGIATIYRQLEKLVADGLVLKYFLGENSAACFEYPGESNEDEKNQFHLKCEKCGQLIHLNCNDMTKLCGHIKDEHGFALDPYRTVLYGVCDSCQTLFSKGEENEK